MDTKTMVCFMIPFFMLAVFTLYRPTIQNLLPTMQIRTSPSYSSHNISADDPSPPDFFVKYPHRYYFLLNEQHKCQEASPFLVLMIPVQPHNRESRDIIRKTWGKETTVLGQVISHFFVLGRSDKNESVEHESQQHHDILQIDFLDSYKNLTIKTMVMFEWLSTHCPHSSFAMKVDSDIFLNVHNVVKMLLEAPRQLYMTGVVTRNAPVVRDHTSKWFLPYSAFPDTKYPPYPLGLGYVFSLDLPQMILEASMHVHAIYIEDVYVGLCMRHLGIELTDPPNGHLFMGTMPRMSKCYWTSVITTLLESSTQLLDVWGTYRTEAQRGC